MTKDEFFAKYGTPTETAQPSQSSGGIRGVLNSIAQSPLTRVAGAGIGGLAGIPLAPFTGGASIPFGAMAGYGGSAAITNSLKDLLGTQDRTPGQQVGQDTTKMLTLGALLEAIPSLASNLNFPKSQLGALRGNIIGEQSVPAEEATNNIQDRMLGGDYYKSAPGGTQQAANSRMASFLDLINPIETISGTATAPETIGQKPTLGINDIYSKLGPFESTGNAYTKGGDAPSSAIGSGTNIVSHATRDYLNTQIPQSAQGLNDIMSSISSFQQTPFGRYLPRLLLGLGIYKGYPEIKKLLTGK